MLKTEPIIQEYEQVLVGNKAEISVTRFFANHTDESQRMDALKVFRFVCEELLHWTPDVFRECLTDEILEIYKLKPLMKRLHLPQYIDPQADLWYIAMLAYPQINNIGREADIILFTYRNVIEGRRERLPHDFFRGERGRLNALLCLQYVVSREVSYTTAESLYEQFAFSGARMSNLFAEKRLEKPCKDFYKGDKLMFLHDALRASGKENNTLYEYYRFRIQMEKKGRTRRRGGTQDDE